MTQIIVSIISGLLTLTGVCITAWCSNRRTVDEVVAKLDVAQAVTDTRLSELTRAVHEHNSFAQRMPVIEEQIRGIQHRLLKLEKEGN